MESAALQIERDDHSFREFLPLSAVVDRLARGMWASWRAPAVARDPAARVIRHPEQSRSENPYGPRVGYVGRRALAVEPIWNAALSGELPIYVAADPASEIPQPKWLPNWPHEPMHVPVGVLKKLIIPRGTNGEMKTLPNHAIRPTLKTAGDSKLLELLLKGHFVVRKDEFDGWYKAECAKGKWKSQTAQQNQKKHRGRPTKQTERLDMAILALLRQNKWNGTTGTLSQLHALLKESIPVLPSLDTLDRVVRRLEVEEGDVRLHRRRRVRRKRGHRQLPQKSTAKLENF